jgi:hypothetical protein
MEEKMRTLFVALLLLLGRIEPAQAQVTFQFSGPGVSIGINVPVYPDLVQVPGYPVYYDPRASTNYFFYDGFYWVYERDTWYSAGWYDGPWHPVAPEYVPLFVLRVPVRYYRRPPPYFAGWHRDAPPRWGERWGRGWEDHRRGWEHWDRHAVPPPAPLPRYQRHYAGRQYPREIQRQHAVREEHYTYESREPVRPPPQRDNGHGNQGQHGQRHDDRDGHHGH